MKSLINKFFIITITLIANDKPTFGQGNVVNNWAGISAKNNYVSVDQDAQNNIIVCGNHGNQVDLDLSNNVLLTGVDGQPFQSFIAKYKENREIVWKYQIIPGTYEGSSIVSSVQVFDVKVDRNGDIICVGSYVRKVHFIEGDSSFLESEFGTNSFILKLDSNGNFIWIKVFKGQTLSNGDTGDCSNSCFSIFTDHSNNIILGGYSRGNVDFDPGDGEYLSQASVNGTSGGYVVKLNKNGEFLWHRLYNSYYNDAIGNVVINKDNHIYIGGYFYDSMQITSNHIDTILGAGSIGTNYFFNAKLNEQGQELWATQITIPSGSMNRLRVDDSNNLYVAGEFNDFMGIQNMGENNVYQPHNYFAGSSGTGDGYIIKYSDDGKFLWCHTIGTKYGDKVFDFDLVENNEIILGVFIRLNLQEYAYYDGEPLIQSISNYTTDYTAFVRLNSLGQPINYSLLGYNAQRMQLIENSSIIVLGKVYSSFDDPFDFDPNPNLEYYLPEYGTGQLGFIHRLTVFNTTEYSGNIILGPNPTSSIVTVYIKDAPTDLTLFLVSVTGEIVFQIDNANQIETIDLSKYSHGMYLIRAIGNNFIASQKVIKY